MENKKVQNSKQQGFQNVIDEDQRGNGSSGANLSDEDVEPVLDEEDMKENHLKEEDLDNIVWDKPAQPEEDLSTATTEKDIID